MNCKPQKRTCISRSAAYRHQMTISGPNEWGSDWSFGFIPAEKLEEMLADQDTFALSDFDGFQLVEGGDA